MALILIFAAAFVGARLVTHRGRKPRHRRESRLPETVSASEAGTFNFRGFWRGPQS